MGEAIVEALAPHPLADAQRTNARVPCVTRVKRIATRLSRRALASSRCTRSPRHNFGARRLSYVYSRALGRVLNVLRVSLAVHLLHGLVGKLIHLNSIGKSKVKKYFSFILVHARMPLRLLKYKPGYRTVRCLVVTLCVRFSAPYREPMLYPSVFN